jgi:hypothetical protein
VRKDREVEDSNWQADVIEGNVITDELQIAVGGDVGGGEARSVERDREWQHDSRHDVIPMVAYVCETRWHLAFKRYLLLSTGKRAKEPTEEVDACEMSAKESCSNSIRVRRRSDLLSVPNMVKL